MHLISVPISPFLMPRRSGQDVVVGGRTMSKSRSRYRLEMRTPRNRDSSSTDVSPSNTTSPSSTHSDAAWPQYDLPARRATAVSHPSKTLSATLTSARGQRLKTSADARLRLPSRQQQGIDRPQTISYSQNARETYLDMTIAKMRLFWLVCGHPCALRPVAAECILLAASLHWP